MTRSHPPRRRPPRVAGLRQYGRSVPGEPSSAASLAAPPQVPSPAGPGSPPAAGSSPGPRPSPRPHRAPQDTADPPEPDTSPAEPAAEPATGSGPEEAGPRALPEPVPTGAGPRRGRAVRGWWLVGVAGAVVVVLAVVTTTLMLRWRRAEARADALAEVPAVARTDAARLLSYDYRHIQSDADAAARLTTGQYRDDYRHSMNQLIIPQARQVHAVVQAEVINAGVTSVSDDGRQAVVLVYVNQTVTNTRITGSRVDQVRVRLTLVRVGDGWRVSKVDSL